MNLEYYKNGNWNNKDEYYTPQILVEPILKFIKPNSTVWCPFDNELSEFVLMLKEAGHKVIYSHIWDLYYDSVGTRSSSTRTVLLYIVSFRVNKFLHGNHLILYYLGYCILYDDAAGLFPYGL